MNKLSPEAFEQRKREFMFKNTQRVSDARTLCFNHCGELESFNPRQLPAVIEYFEFGTQLHPQVAVVLLHIRGGRYDG